MIFVGVDFMSGKTEKETELFRRMYYCLFNAITDVQNYKTKEEIIKFLQTKQAETEEMYISFGEI